MPTGLTNHGRITQRVGVIDWSATPVGHAAEWPDLLLNAVNMCLSMPYPSIVFWSNSHLVFFNDAFKERIGNLDEQRVLGQPAERSIPKLWEWMRTPVQTVMRTGDSHTNESLLLSDELPVSWTIVPLVGERGGIQGVFC